MHSAALFFKLPVHQKNQFDEASVNTFIFQQLGFCDMTIFLNSVMGLFSECHL